MKNITFHFFCIFSALCLASISFASGQSEKKSTAQLLKDCQSDRDQCEGVIMVMLGQPVSLGVACVPDKLTESESAMAKPIIDWLNRHPETSNQAYEKGIDLAARAVYPCSRPYER